MTELDELEVDDSTVEVEYWDPEFEPVPKPKRTMSPRQVTYADPDNLVLVDATTIHPRSVGRVSPFLSIMEKVKANKTYHNKPVLLSVYGKVNSAVSTASQMRRRWSEDGFTFDTADHEKGTQLVVVYDPKLDTTLPLQVPSSAKAK